MKQQVDITLKLSLWLNATLSEDDIVTHVRSALPLAFGEELTAMQNPVDILEIQEESSIYGPPPKTALSPQALRQLPNDPDGMNEDRACWAGRAVAAFQRATRTDDEDALCDLLADLMHWADRNNYDFEAALLRGRDHYAAETASEEVLPC